MRSNRILKCLFSMVISTVFLSAVVSAQGQAPSPTPSPTPQSSRTPTLESQFFKTVLRDQEAIWTSPFRLHGRDARWLAPLGLGTAALIATDRRTGDEVAESTSQLNASRIVSYAGSTYGVAAIPATFYLFVRAKHDARARETGWMGARS